MLKRTVVLAAFVSAAALAAAAQERDNKDQIPPIRVEIIVTATRIETPAREVASSMTLVTRRDLDRADRATAFEVFRDVAGLDVLQNGGPGSAASVFIRGANSEHLLVMVDGVEVNDPMNPSRSFDIAHLSLAGVDRIEVLRGPQSTLFGSDALAGVMNILTAKGQGRPRVSFTAQAGSFKTGASRFEFGGSSGSAHFSLGLSQYSAEGISAASPAYAGNSEKDGYRNWSLAGRAGAAFRNGFEADVFVRATTAKTDLDNFGGPGGDDPNSVQTYSSVFLRGQVRGLLAGNRWEQKIGISYLRSDRRLDNPTDSLHPFDSETGRYQSGLVKVDWQNNFFLGSAHTVSFGADLAREQGESTYVSISAYGPYESPFPRRTADLAGLYLQDQIKLDNVAFATAGVRLDQHSRAGTALTFRLAPTAIIEGTQTRFKATLGTGFKAPSLYQLYAPETAWGPVGNSSLRPEESLGWDAGLEQPLWGGGLVVGLTYFHNDFRNLIDFDFGRGYINIGRARTRGLEFLADLLPGEKLCGRVSYTRLEAKDLDTGGSLLRRAKDHLLARLDYQFAEQWAFGLSAVYSGRRPDTDFSGWVSRPVVLAAYTLLHATLDYSLNPRLGVFIRLDNILNARYENVYGYGAPGRAVYVGCKIK
jgi:vitamin B12 transporter